MKNDEHHTIKIGNLKIDAPFQAKVTLLHGEEHWHITDRHGLNILEHNEDDREDLIRYAVDALNDYRPWRYPSRGELPMKERRCVVTLKNGTIPPFVYLAETVLFCADNIRAWKYADVHEPAPVIEEKAK